MAKKYARNKEANFLVQGSILAIASVVVRLIGIAYRIPLTNILGDGGNSAYSNAYAIYSLVWMVASFGIPTAVSKMVAERIGNKQEYNARRVFSVAILFAIVVGGVAFSVLFFGAHFLAYTVYRRPEIMYALMVLAPTVWVSAFLGVFRGFFQGHGNMVPTAISQIVEQVVNAAMSIIGAYVLWHMGRRLDLLQTKSLYADAFGAAGGTVGTLSGAVAGLLVCFFIYSRYFTYTEKPGVTASMKESRKELMTTLTLMILPITLNSAIYNISSVLDSFIFSNFASFSGISDAVYKISWNAYEGKYHLLTHVPLAFATALSASAVPNLSRSLKTAKVSEINDKIRQAVRFAMVVAIPSCVGLAVLARPILMMLFAGTPDSNELAAVLLRLGCVTVILYSFSTITNGVLQGIGRVSEPAKNAGIALIGHFAVLLGCLFLTPMKIYAVVLSDIVFGLFMNILNYRSIYRAIRFRFEFLQTFVLPLVSSCVMGVGAWSSYEILHLLTKSNALSCLLAICVAVVLYAIVFLGTGALTESDLKSFPKGNTIIKVARKFKLLRTKPLGGE